MPNRSRRISGSKTNKSLQTSGSKTNKPKLKWRTVEEFPDYKVSEDGDVMRIDSGKILKQRINEYYYVKLSLNNKTKNRYIHKLVAKAFVPNPNNLPKVDHIDNNKLNNKVSNLRWYTQSNNAKSYHENFRQYPVILQCDLNKNIIKEWKNTSEIIKNNPGYNRKTINNNLRGASKTAYGSIWKYKVEKIKKQIILKDDEIFKKIKKFKNNDLSEYEVSNYGNIKNDRGQLLSLTTKSSGYKCIHLNNKITNKRHIYYINVLVAHTFLTNDDPINKIEVNHIDEIKSNNYYKNLEWTTHPNNMIHSIGKSVEMIDPKSNEPIKMFNSISEAATYLNISKNNRTHISKACKNKNKIAYGYKWRYVKDDIFEFTNEEIKRVNDFDVYVI